MSIYLDIAAAVILTFFTLSLVVTATNEAFAIVLNSRGRMLLRTLRDLLGDDGLLDRIAAAAPLRATLRAASGTETVAASTFPDRLPPAAVADAWLAATEAPFAGANDAGLGFDLARAARDATADARAELAALYDAAMVQLARRYKRRRQAWSLAIGLILAAGLNVDVIALATGMHTDPAKRAAIVAYLDDPAIAPDALFDRQPGDNADGTASDGDGVGPSDIPAALQRRLDALDDWSALAGFGWELWPWQMDWSDGETYGALARSFAAWTIAALAAVIGAPFWFDLLNRTLTARRAARDA